ncbi:MAG: helix-turn-helix domain-containing protein [Nitrospirae bacterium]|nr:helix-turn-helix domain-containing protein [Nitrospirota bacterium]
MINAEKVYRDIINMPIGERERLFSIIARYGFEKEYYTHEEVFGDINSSPFTIKEAAEYLGIAEITIRRWVKNGVLKHKRIGKNIVFEPYDLKTFKTQRN